MSSSHRRKPPVAANTLNDLSGTEWIKRTRTWLICDSPRYHRNKPTELHPARYPEELVTEFLLFFTKRGGWVLDPFAGSGATIVACQETERNGIGIEVSSRYAALADKRLRQQLPSFNGHWRVHCGDATALGEPTLWRNWLPPGLETRRGLPLFDFVMTSPPYWNMLGTSRGGVRSKHKQRADAGLDTRYSDDPKDLGNIADYNEFVEALGAVFDKCHALLKPGKYLVVVAQNLRAPDGTIKPLAFDLARRISRTFLFQGERIWCQNTKPLGIWGYPTTFVPNYHHHYCLIFRRRATQERDKVEEAFP